MQKCASQPHKTTPQSQHRRISLRYPEREESIMSSTPTEFHKIWIDQCEAAEGIRENFGSLKALDYLIGEKLCSYLMAAESDALFSAEVPAYVAEIRRLFTAEEIHDYLNCLERTKYLASPERRRTAPLLAPAPTASGIKRYGETKARSCPGEPHP
jgi:hypothetical protein